MFRRHARLLRAAAASILNDEDLVDDALQEAFTKALLANRQFAGEREALNFMNRVVINTAIDLYRKRKRRCRVFLPLNQPWQLFEKPGKCLRGKVSDDPLEGLLRKELRRWEEALLEEVRAALDALPRLQRQAIVLLLSRRDRSCREVCAEAGIPYSTARSRMQGGINRIRAVIRQGKALRVLVAWAEWKKGEILD